jgi:hypothetical protein
MKTCLRAPAAALFAAFAILVSARADPAALRLTFEGKTTEYSQADIAALPHKTVTAYDAHEKKSHDYAGVPVQDLLARAGVAFGEKLRGPAMHEVVIARTRDHYSVVFALAEFEPAFRQNPILLVDKEDGATLGEGAGPLRLVAPGDQRPARWARMLESLEVVSVGEGR